MSDNIHVAVRLRPLIARERESTASIHWKAEGSCIVQKNQPSTKFQFDRVFREIDTNEIVYSEFCAPLVKSVIDGFNGTIFAYGQTSSGKTFTMMGKDDGKNLGIAHYTISDIFNHIEMSDREFLLRVSYMEIYNESIIDLLTEKSENLKLKEDRDGLVKVSGLTEHIVQKPDQVLQLLRKGEKKRKIGDTKMNERSSRSHSIFQVIIESGVRGDDNSAVNVSQFNLVDLAGSERAAQTGATGTRLKESININKSLLMLSQVISQLSERPDQYINYRDSKITRILQNSLGGNARTAIICTVTPATVEETLSTIKFATRAKSIQNKPQVNEVLNEQALLKRYANEIKKLTQELEATKEEKAQQNKSLQEQIHSLRNKFVSQMALKNEKRSARRETWGGCLDAAKFKIPFLPPLKKKGSMSDVSETFCSSGPAFTIPEKEPLRRTSKFSNLYSDLSIVDEEKEFDMLDGTFLSRHSKSMSVRVSGVPLCLETGVQTDISSIENEMDNERIVNLQTRVKQLEDELAELSKFTSLEKQYYAEDRIKEADIRIEEKSEVTNLKSQIDELEKNVATHLRTISELQEDIELKNDEIQLQNEIAECLKEELLAKENEISSIKTTQDTSKEIKSDCPSQTSFSEEDDTVSQKLSSLSSEICKNKKLISDLQYEKDSKDKQIALCNDKIKIQDQIILSLQSEISLKSEESVSSKTTLYVHSSSQTFYLDDISQDSYNCKKYSEYEDSVFEGAGDSTLNHNQVVENCSKESSFQNPDAIDIKTCDSCKVLENHHSANMSLKLALKELTDLKQNTIEFMERSMDEVYFRSVCEPDISEKPASDLDLIRMESGILKNLLQRVEFYLKDKCESYAYFQNLLKDTSDEVIELKSKLTDAEDQLRKNETVMENLYELFKDLESKASTFCKKFEAPKSLEWKDSISSTEGNKTSKYISLLKMVNKILNYFAEGREMLSSKTNSLDELEKSSEKLSKGSQTIDDERIAQMAQEISTLEVEKKYLLIDISNLNSRIEKIKKIKEAESMFEDKENLYKTEINDLKLMLESQKNALIENTSKCVQSVEEKYDQMMDEQKSQFCEELDRVKDLLKGQIREKELNYKELVVKHEQEIENLTNEHLKEITNYHNKLASAQTVHFNERTELENTIGRLKKEICSRNEGITKLRYKCKSYATELHQLKASAEKSTRDIEVQTSSALIEDRNKVKSSKQLILNSNTRTRDFSVQTDKANSTDTTNDEGAAILIHKNEALSKEVESLKRELSGKLMLLRSCQCRLIPKSRREAGEKSSKSDENIDPTCSKGSERRGEIVFSSAADVLQSDIVKKAVELEVQKERHKLGDTGTASTLVNCMLKKDLHSRDKALAAARKEIAELKAYAKRRNVLPVKENQPFLQPKVEDVTEHHKGTNPFPLGEVPKLPTKNILKEKNKAPQINHPAANKMTENINGKQDLEEVKRQLEQKEIFEPKCKQQ